jgi:hypothetical protein
MMVTYAIAEPSIRIRWARSLEFTREASRASGPVERGWEMECAYAAEVRGDSVRSRYTACTAYGATVLRLSLLALLVFLPASAHAIDPALCADDGVTEVPPFADGRDGNQCLMIDPGNGDPPVPFQYEVFHKTGMSRAARDSGDEPPGGEWIDHNMDAYGRCRTIGDKQYCSLLFWDTTFDNYLSQAGRNDDVMTYGGQGLEYMYFKNSNVLNGWKCGELSSPWYGPNGITCPIGPKSRSHSDGIQMLGTMANDGWLIFQDSALVNAHTLILNVANERAGNDVGYDVDTNFLFQGFQLSTINTPIGESLHWIDDCYARGSDTPCENNKARGTMPVGEIWLIDVYGNVLTSLGRDGWTEKVVVVNTGCGTKGCGGEVGFSAHGWPHPLGRTKVTGPGVCPNGYIGTACQADSNTACFCYTSLENALNDVPTTTSGIGDCPASHCPHKAPPFVHLSGAGWEDPPAGATNPRPRPPVLLP